MFVNNILIVCLQKEYYFSPKGIFRAKKANLATQNFPMIAFAGKGR